MKGSLSRVRSSGGAVRRSALVTAAGLVASGMMAFTFSPAFAQFSASIQNTVNEAASGFIALEESSGALLCTSTDGTDISTNSSTCSTINKYGGNLAMEPGQTVSTSFSIENVGTIGADAFNLTAGACTQSANGSPNGSATDLCSQYTIVIKSGSTTLFSGTATALATQGTVNLDSLAPAPNVSVPFTIDVTLGNVGNSYQGLKISQPLTWTVTAGS